ncbi:MAG: ATP-binding protein [Desulfuromusa sp.]|jgi:PAS domain S-box-containing protein|nr:ATP-binding protein [Desulfuromusa sp.]
MTHINLNSLRIRLMLIVLLAVIPMIVLILYTASEERRNEVVDVQDGVMPLARLIALQEDQLINASHQLMIALSHFPSVVDGNPAACNALFANLKDQHFTRYANFGVANMNGDVFCSAIPLAEPINIADREYFKNAVKAGDFSIGDYLLGRITDKPSLIFGYPIIGEVDKIKGVVYAAMDLEWFTRFEADVTSLLSKGTTLAKIDSDGIVLANDYEHEEILGKSFPIKSVLEAIKTQGKGVVEAIDSHGVPRLYAFRPLGSKIASGEIFVIVGIPKEIAFAEINHVMVRNLSLLGLVALFGLVAVWFSSDRLIFRPTNALVDVTRRLCNGDFGARSGIPFQRGELGHLAHAFDEMAETLQRQENDRKQADQVIRTLAENWQLTFDAIGDAISIIDTEDVILQSNKAMAVLTGKPLHEINGSTHWEVVHYTSEPVDACPITRMRETLRRETRELQRDGRWFSVVADPIINENGDLAGYVHIMSDTTEQKKLGDQFRQAQKMEAVGRLAGGVAHDFNNMLSVIIGYTGLTLANTALPGPLRHNLTEVLNAANRSADITRQLLAFARKQVIEPRVLDLNTAVEGMLKMLRRLIGEDIDLAWLPAAGLGNVNMDPPQVDQILANLCVNARDAIADVGKVTIETANVSFDAAYCAEHAGFVPGDFILLAISDDGCGMDKETINNIFEPFFTTKEVGRGTGLGLSTVYGIVKQSGGFINVYSEPDMGTTFKVYLSRHAGKEETIETKVVTKTPASQGETLLLVEDESSILKLGQKILSELGYIVLAAGTPMDAIQLAQEYTGEIQLLITDVIMPEMNGRELSERLHSLRPDIKTLFMSGYTSDVIAHHGVLEVGVHFLQKPFSMSSLGSKVREALDG